MSKLTVNEYAKKYQITRQAVYSRIKKGTLQTIEENGVLHIYDDIEEVKSNIKSNKKDDCHKLIKKLLKRIDTLENKLDKEREKNNSLILAYVDEMKALYLPNNIKKKKKNKK